MKSKIFIPFILSVLFFIVGCKNNFLENQANVNFNLDLSKIVETSRSDTVQNTDYILRVFAYNASNYKTGDEIENLVLLAQTESYVDINGQVKSILNIEIGLNVIFVAKLYEFVDEKLIYSGVSDVVKIKPTNNKVDLVLKKQNTDSEGDVEEKTFTVTFINSGEIIESLSIQEGNSATEPTQPIKTGYIFDGWYTSEDGGKTLSKKFDFATLIATDFTLYAKWNQISYTVCFNANGQNSTGAMENQNFIYDIEQSLTKNTFSRNGYRFATWNTKEDGTGITYNDEAKVKNLTTENNAQIVLYAQWIVEGDYLILYELNEGTNSTENPTSYNVESETITLKEPTKQGYEFECWQTSSGEIISQITKGSVGDITLYAKWNPRTDTLYTVNHYKQEMTGEYLLFQTETCTGTTDSETLAVAKSYDGFEAKSFEQKVILADGSTVIDIYYTRNIYTVTFICEDISDSQQQSVKYEGTVSVPLTEPTKDGYTFVGWYTSNDDGVTLLAEFNFATPITGDITLYAKFELTSYTASEAAELIALLDTEGPHDVIVMGDIKSANISSISSALKANEVAKVNLDLSRTTGVTSIDDSAFEGCSTLISVIIPVGVTSIGEYAFRNCSSLKSITIPEGVTSIGKYAFYYCTGLTLVNMSTGDISFGEGVFRCCSSLESITIPDGVTTIGHSAFQSCSSLTTVNIPESVTSIGSGAFNDCSKLTSITIPSGVTSIENLTFKGCSSLESITIPNGVTSIKQCAFMDCSKLTSINIPLSVTSIVEYAFENCSSLTTITIPDGVTTIEKETFYGCSNLTSITIPSSVTSIGDSVFYGCTSLTAINIPESVTSIGGSAFYNCSKLQSIDIPKGIENIGDKFFYNCSKLTSVDIPKNVESIGQHAFYGCSGLTGITIPEGVTSIGSSAFKNCSGLTEITIPEGVTSIENETFYGCNKLTSVNILGSVTSIGESVFYDCTSLITITIPEGVTSIENKSFYGCTSLTEITIPSSVLSIGDYAFYNCSGLTGITIPENVGSIGHYAFYGCSGLTSITIPKNIASIGQCTFNGCSSLTEITIPENVTSIGNAAFRYCSKLTSITIPISVTSIASYAFANSDNLTTVNYTGTETDWNNIEGLADCGLSEEVTITYDYTE